jgi:hypothetical protein
LDDSGHRSGCYLGAGDHRRIDAIGQAGQNQWQNRFPKSHRANFDGSPQTCLLPLKKAVPAQGSPRAEMRVTGQPSGQHPQARDMARMTDAKLVACLEAYSRVKLRTVAG